MINKQQAIKQLYQDAWYFRLLRQGYITKQAQQKISKLFKS